MPQTVAPGSEWEKLWPNIEIREQWINRIANLVPLTRKKNSEAQNYDFRKKKEIYFKGKNGTTTYPLTTQVLSENTWTSGVVEIRQKELMDNFIECWELQHINAIEKKDVSEEDNCLFYISNKRGANSVGYSVDGGFVVKEGSRVSDSVVEKFKIYYPNAYRLRERLCNDNVIIDGVF